MNNSIEVSELNDIFPSLSPIPHRYMEILKEHNNSARPGTEIYRIKVLSNVTVNPIKEVLELTCWTNAVSADVSIGSYDNIVQDSLSLGSLDCVAVFWEMWNLFPAAPARINAMSQNEFSELLTNIANDIRLVVENLSRVGLVLFNRFSSIPWQRFDGSLDRFMDLVNEANSVLDSLARPNMRLLDVSQIYNHQTIASSIDSRHLYKTKSIFTVSFYRHYSSMVCSEIKKIKFGSKKVLVLDCDNTLWGGVIGEDGLSGVQMNSTHPIGAIFHEVQWIFKGLKNSGALLCLNTKNNPEDIDEVLNKHTDLVLGRDDLTYIAANWRPKSENIVEMAKALNLGLDAFVFVDDSAFEIGEVKNELPDVVSLRVPSNIVEYPQFARNLVGLFWARELTDEDRNRTEMYKAQAERDELLNKSASIGEYLASLSMKMSVAFDEKMYVNRLAQMTQKTNQFNLTTWRMSEPEVHVYMSSDDKFAASFALSDRYGDNGVTGCAFVTLSGSGHATIDNFLLSCRVLGRSAESVFLSEIISELAERGVEVVYGEFVPSAKNDQAKAFYEENGFVVTNRVEERITYTLSISDWVACGNKNIEVLREG